LKAALVDSTNIAKRRGAGSLLMVLPSLAGSEIRIATFTGLLESASM